VDFQTRIIINWHEFLYDMEDYSDIINLPHHVSKVHPPMSMMQRAAQFAPFAALNGHQAAIEEAARTFEEENP